MTTSINLLISFTAGFFSFLTPCVLPLVPSYIALIGGKTLQEIKAGQYRRSKLIMRTLFFIAGFSVVFVLMGVFIWGTFQILSGISTVLNIAAGVIVILLGLNIIFDWFSFLSREKRVTVDKRAESYTGSLLAGMAFGAGWSPCIGPLLGGIISLTATGDSVAGVFNLAAYSLGLGVPFLLLSIAFLPVTRSLERVKKHFQMLKTISGVFLVFIGLLILLGQFLEFNAFFTRAGFAIEQAYTAHPAGIRTLIGGLLLTVGLLPTGIWGVRALRQGAVRISRASVAAWLVSAVLITVGVLEFVGVLSVGRLFSGWLLVQEINPF
ncbi:MAG TPA: cytochrome c biogenesis protein CcdA [Spirochaetia bacterium]|nr:cytochrome c biogenesis protein CcdA [Spirochaetia bacterium]